MTMDLRSLIRSSADRLTNADQSIARILLDDPEVAAMLTASQLATRAQVHEAAATRFAQRLGFKGFPQLRTALRRDVLAARDAASRLETSVARMRDRGIVGALVDDDVAALRALPATLDQRQLEAAAKAVWAADRLFIFGRGHAEALCELANRRFRRFGKAVLPLRGEPRDVAETLHCAGSRDVVLAFAFRRMPRLLAPVLQLAADRGAKRLLICDPLIAASGLPVTIHLSAPRGRPDHEFQTLTVPMLILNALVLTVGAQQGDTAEKSLETLATLIEEFEDL
jgi:DNA-binding MurR/RpiR family transcriptional regulator